MRALKLCFLCIFYVLTRNFCYAIPTEGSKIMISGPSPYAIEVGQKVALEGGNVVDVAVAVGLTLSVTSPYFAALGGGGFALVKMKNDVEVIDFRETAPKKTHPNYYKELPENSSITGPHAIGIPGFPAGLYELHKKYGKLSWAKLFKHPVRLALMGFRVSGEWVEKTETTKERFNKEGLNYFFKKNATPYKPGELLKQPQLAKALNLLKRYKLNPFYKGVIAQDIIKTVNASGGQLTLDDFKNYKVRWLKPLTSEFKGHKIHLMPPPSSGGIVIYQALELVKRLEPQKFGRMSVNEYHMLGEILSRSFRGRSLLGDPDFHENPMTYLTSKKYLDELEDSISKSKTKKLKPLTEKDVSEHNETTHFSILDKDGNAIALTVTLNGRYGSAMVSKQYGIALNNEMDDFTTIPDKPNMFGLIQGKGNLVQPGKRPLSSMSPTLIEKDGKIVASMGAPGGPRIISGVFQGIYRLLVTGLDIDKAIQAPRVHHQFLPHKLYVDKDLFSVDIIEGLKDKGHEVEESWNSRVYGVRKNTKGYIEAGFDARGEGAVGGY